MISVKDRAPLHPGRVQLNPVTGQPNIFDLMRADSPTEVGTALNRRTMQLLQADIRTLPIATGNTVAAGDAVDVISGRVVGKSYRYATAGEVRVGGTIKLMESGAPVEYLVVHQGLPSAMYDASCNGTWLIRKDIFEDRAWDTNNINDYANSTINTYLNSTFYNRFDATTKAAIKQAKVPYRPGSGQSATVNSGASVIPCKVFLASISELGANNGNFANDGSTLAFFNIGGGNADVLRKAQLSGVYSTWLQRSPSTAVSNGVAAIHDLGSPISWSPSQACGIRPVVILDAAYITTNIVYTERTQAIALQSGVAGQPIDIVFDGVAEMPGAIAGTEYGGTGVFGYSHQDGWLWVGPYWARPRKNLLDNAWFEAPYLVNQRGQSSYTAGYCVDRWWAAGGTFDVALRKFTATAPWGRIYQPVDNAFTLSGKTVTLSADVVNGSSAGLVLITQYTSAGPKDFYFGIPPGFSGIISVTATLDQAVSGLSTNVIVTTAGNSVVINKAKLELGSVSTLHLDTPPSPAEQELNRQVCNLYYRLWTSEAGRANALTEVNLMRLYTPTLGSISVGGSTYYYASADL